MPGLQAQRALVHLDARVLESRCAILRRLDDPGRRRVREHGGRVEGADHAGDDVAAASAVESPAEPLMGRSARLSQGAPTSRNRASAMRVKSSSSACALDTMVMRIARMRRSFGLFSSSSGARQLSRTCTQHTVSRHHARPRRVVLREAAVRRVSTCACRSGPREAPDLLVVDGGRRQVELAVEVDVLLVQPVVAHRADGATVAEDLHRPFIDWVQSGTLLAVVTVDGDSIESTMTMRIGHVAGRGPCRSRPR